MLNLTSIRTTFPELKKSTYKGLFCVEVQCTCFEQRMQEVISPFYKDWIPLIYAQKIYFLTYTVERCRSKSTWTTILKDCSVELFILSFVLDGMHIDNDSDNDHCGWFEAIRRQQNKRYV